MNCKKAQSLMLDALYGELPFSKDRDLRKHLDSCERCSLEFSSHKATLSAFQKVDFEKPPAALTDLMKDIAIKQMEQEALFAQPRRPRYWKPALASAAAALLLVVGVIYYLPQAQMNTKSDKLASTSEVRAVGESTNSLSFDHLKLEEAQSPAPLSQATAPAEAPSAIVIYPDAEMREEAAPAGSFRYRRLGESSDADLPMSAPEPSAASAEKKETWFAEPPDEAGSAAFRQKQQVAVPEKMPKVTSRSARSDLSLSDKNEMGAEELLAKGKDLSRNREFEQAAGLYQDVIDLAPKDESAAEAQFRLGQVYQETGKYREALAEYRAVIKNHPDYDHLGEVHIAAGDCHLALGEHADAVRSYEAACDGFPPVRDLALKKLISISSPADSSDDLPGAQEETQK